MAKPILHVKLIGDTPTEFVKENIFKSVKEKLNNEYHVLVSHTLADGMKIEVECFNDCKGLTDVDIELLIKSINHDTVPRG